MIAQVLELGTFEEGQRLRQALGDGRLAQVLQRAEPGWLSPRSLICWPPGSWWCRRGPWSRDAPQERGGGGAGPLLDMPTRR